MSTFCLYHTVAVLPCSKSRSCADHKRGIRDTCPQILLRQDRIHDHIRPEPFPALHLRIDHHRDTAPLQHCLRRLTVFCQKAFHLFNLHFFFIHCPRESHCPPYSERDFDLCHQDLMPGSIKPGCDARRQIPCASNQYFHFPFSSRFQDRDAHPPLSPKQVTIVFSIPSSFSMLQISRA